MLKSTAKHEAFWRDRKIDWEKDYFATWDHAHRGLILRALAKDAFASVLEVGCASGPNLYLIQKQWPGVQVGGIDINPEAIDAAKRLVPSAAVLEVGPADDLFLSDKSADVVLTDMALIYIDPRRISKVISEIKRVARQRIILCEFHSTNPLKRAALAVASGYWAYNWTRKLETAGFYDVELEKIPEDKWPGGEPQKSFGYIITAKI